MKIGISILHGRHQVAQKSSSTTLPLYSASRTSLPSTSLSVKSRFAGFASATHAAPAAGFGAAAFGGACATSATLVVMSRRAAVNPTVTILRIEQLALDCNDPIVSNHRTVREFRNAVEIARGDHLVRGRAIAGAVDAARAAEEFQPESEIAVQRANPRGRLFDEARGSVVPGEPRRRAHLIVPGKAFLRVVRELDVVWRIGVDEIVGGDRQPLEVG